MAFVSKKAADAYDRIMDAAVELTELIEQSEIQISEDDLEKLTIYLAQRAVQVKAILKTIKGSPGSSQPLAGLRPETPDGTETLKVDFKE